MIDSYQVTGLSDLRRTGSDWREPALSVLALCICPACRCVSPSEITNLTRSSPRPWSVYGASLPASMTAIDIGHQHPQYVSLARSGSDLIFEFGMPLR